MLAVGIPKTTGFEYLFRESSFVLNNRYDQEITRLFYKQAPYGSTSLLFVLVATYYYFHNLIPGVFLASWLIVNTIIIATTLLTFIAYQFDLIHSHDTHWFKAYTILVALQDIQLGMLGPMILFLNEEIDQLLILFIMAGMSAGAIATRAIQFKVYFISLSALLLPVAITYAFMDNRLASVILALTIVYYIFMLFVGKNYSDSIRNTVLLWLNLEEEIETRKQTEAELREAMQKAEVASKAKTQFLASVSHELRTPLNGIIGFSSVLNKQSLGSTEKDYLGQIQSCSNSLLNLVNDILDVTSYEAGHLELHEHPFNISQEMDEVAALGQRLCEDKGLNYEYQLAQEVPHHLIGDARRVKQIINNLINNAVKYTDQGGIKLLVAADSVNGKSARLRFSIEDSGIGIPDDAHDTLFDNFTQAANFEERKHEGVGLGLAIVKSLLQQLGGEISFESEVGKGTRFDVLLPFTINTNTGNVIELEQGDKTQVPVTASTAVELNQLRILIVDDNDVNRLVLKTFLTPYDIPCTMADSGTAALELLQQQEFDVVLLDINMPDMSGLEVRERYCQNNSDCPQFIAVTAHAFKEEIDNFLRVGFSDCLIKPISEDEVINLLKRIAVKP